MQLDKKNKEQDIQNTPKEKIIFTKKQWILLLIFNTGFILCGALHSMQAPFYPSKADEKGVPPSQYGLVFGVFYLTSLIFSPLCGKVISYIGAILTGNIGLFVAGVTSILFGLLDKINNAVLFFSFSLIIRIMEAIGVISFKTAGFSIFATQFPDNRATTFAFLQSCLGFGIVVGPPVGGILYQWKGYLIPFLLMGVLLLIIAVLLAIFLTQDDEISNCKRSRKGFLLLLKQPEVLLGSAASFGSCMNVSFFQATLEPHLRTFQLSPIKIGSMFIINGMTHTCMCPLWGVVCDKWIPPQFVWSIGAFIMSVGLLLLGPAPYLSLQLSMPLVICALIIHGFGQSAEIVSSFHCFGKVALKLGFPDDVNTYGIVSAQYNAAFSLGGFVAPSLGGFLFDNIGFPWAVHVLVCFHMVLLILTLLYNFLYTENKFPKRNEEEVSDFEKKALADVEMPCYQTNEILPLEKKEILVNGAIPCHKTKISAFEDKEAVLATGTISSYITNKFLLWKKNQS